MQPKPLALSLCNRQVLLETAAATKSKSIALLRARLVWNLLGLTQLGWLAEARLSVMNTTGFTTET
jgi:hypothetical protein